MTLWMKIAAFGLLCFILGMQTTYYFMKNRGDK